MTTNRSSKRTINQNEMQHKAFTTDITKSINEQKRTIDFIISNETPDRHGDIILLKGWDTKQFMENPVVLFAHSRNVPPIGKALRVWKSGGNLNATAQFMDKDISPFADSIFQMFKEGFLKAVSVGFMPKEFEIIQDDEGFIEGFKFIKQELLEFSAVPIPSNPDALVKARTKGIDVEPIGKWAEDVLDDWVNSGVMIRETYNIGKKQIELIRRKAIGETMTYQVPESKQKELLEKNLKAAAEFRKNQEKEKELDKHDNAYRVNRSAIAYANSLIEKNSVNIEEELEGTSTELKEHLAVSKDKQISVCHIIKNDILYRSAIVTSKRDSAFDGDIDVFNAASRLLKKIDGDDIFKNNEYENWDEDFPTKEFDPKNYEELDAMQHKDGDIVSVFYNNSPQELIIQESLFKSSGGAIGFTGSCDNLSIVFNGSNADLSYYPYAKGECGSFVCRLDSDITSVPIVVLPKIEVSMKVDKDSEDAYNKEMNEESENKDLDENEDDSNDENNSNDENEDKVIKIDAIMNINLTPMEQVNCLDAILIDLEETLEKNPSLINPKKGDKRFIRKIKFVAQYMKELAEAINPITTETKTTVTEGTIPVEFNDKVIDDEDAITEKDVDEYIINNLGPTLDKIVKRNLDKLRGKLD